MDTYNAIVDCDVARLNIPLRPWFARQGHGFAALLRRIPADVSGVYVRVYTGSNASTDIDAEGLPDGSWKVRVQATALASVIDNKYEVHGTDADGVPCALGEGRLCVQAFGAPADND